MNVEARQPKKTYANYMKYYVQADPVRGTFDYGYEGHGIFLQGIEIWLCNHDDEVINLSGRKAVTDWEQRNYHGDTRLTMLFNTDVSVKLEFILSRRGIEMNADCPDGWTLHTKGRFIWGYGEDSFAVCIGRREQDLRAADGPAVSAEDNALFDRAEGSAAEISGADWLRLSYDWELKGYLFHAEGNHWMATVSQQLYENLFHTSYKKINKNNTFPVPPVGWMTWYAVRFNACEETVLKNAAWQKEHLADFGANTIWVDWEWYHSAFDVHGPEGIDFFNPDPVRYPHGLRYLADKIREMGLVPALWIGPTNEPSSNDFIKNNPDAVLARKVAWCGEYFFDLTNEKYLEEYLPAVVRKVKEWGFEAVKWDCLPVTLLYADQYHEDMAHPELTSEQALREVVKRVRKMLGKDFYMLSCAGAADREILFAVDIFDGARIGGDIFNWREFINDFVARVMRFYAYHNTEIYCDPDNLVVRPEFNTLDQAISRTSFLSVLGLPVTFGDNLPDLPPERVELLKRCIPALDAHSMDIRESCHEPSKVIANLTISRPFEQWNVVDVLNLLENDNRIVLNMQNDLHLEKGSYLVYDFWNKEFLGVVEDSIVMDLRPCASRVLSVRKCQGIPQIVSTSRHISQGGVDLKDVKYEEKTGLLKGVSSVVAGDPYEIRTYDPKSNTLVARQFTPDKTGDMSWEIAF